MYEFVGKHTIQLITIPAATSLDITPDSWKRESYQSFSHFLPIWVRFSQQKFLSESRLVYKLTALGGKICGPEHALLCIWWWITLGASSAVNCERQSLWKNFRINSWEVLSLSLPLKFLNLLFPSLLPPLWYSILSDLNLSSLGLCSQV